MHTSLDDLDRLAVNFIIDLHRKRNFTRKDVTDVLGGIKTVYLNLECLITKAAAPSHDEQKQYVFDTYVRKISKTFDFLNTEYKLLKYLEEKDLYKRPEVYVINIDKVKICSEETYEKRTHLVMTNVRFQIRKFFEIENVLDNTLKHMERLKDSKRIDNFINGSLYKSTEAKNPGKLIIPIFFYSDEFEINDPLSSHNKRHSTKSIYC